MQVQMLKLSRPNAIFSIFTLLANWIGTQAVVANTIVLQAVAKEQVAVGIGAANAGGRISAKEVEAEAITWPAEMRRKLAGSA